MITQFTVRQWIDQLQDLFFVLEGGLQALQDSVRAAGNDQLGDDINRSAAGAIANLLGTLKNQMYPPDGNLLDLQNAERIARAYLDSTQWVEGIAGFKDQVGDVVLQRSEIRLMLANTAQQEQDLLQELLDESSALAQQPDLTAAAFIQHLETAIDILQRTEDNTALIPGQLSKQLARNWNTIITNLQTRLNECFQNGSLPAPDQEAYLTQIAKLLNIRQLLEQAYDFLAEDISADNPLDAVNI